MGGDLNFLLLFKLGKAQNSVSLEMYGLPEGPCVLCKAGGIAVALKWKGKDGHEPQPRALTLGFLKWVAQAHGCFFGGYEGSVSYTSKQQAGKRLLWWRTCCGTAYTLARALSLSAPAEKGSGCLGQAEGRECPRPGEEVVSKDG